MPVPYAFQSPQSVMMPAQPAMTAAPYVHPGQPPFEPQTIPPAPPTHDVRLPNAQIPEEAQKLTPEFSSVQPAHPMEPAESEHMESENVMEPDASRSDDSQTEIKNEPLPPEPEPSSSGGIMDEGDMAEGGRGMSHGHDYPPPELCEPRYGPPDLPVRHPNGRPMGPHRYMDDYSPHYGHGPPPGFGAEPPEYGMTPPHMGSYGRRMPYRDGPLGGHHDIPPEYMEPALPPPMSPPYYDLPAGLMVPLVRLEDTDYEKPLDPDDVHLPPPALPTERLLAAVEQFYCPPTHERTRNNSYVISSEGWEQLGLYEFFKAKAQAKKQKGIPDDRDFNANNEFPGSQGFSEKKDEKRRRYREFKSPDKENSAPVRNGSKGKRHSRSLSRSRSRSPEQSPRRSSRSPSPRPHFSRSRRRSRSRSPVDKNRSPDRSSSPPYLGSGSNSHDRRLDESNKGHQLLRKMGWGGAGLGAAEQGIQDPVDAGDVRDRQDMYKGIGSNLNDPYENFRKSKGQAFINRMKARAEELGKI